MHGRLANRLIESLRYLGVGVGVFLAVLHQDDPVRTFSALQFWVVLSVAGLTGLESLFLGRSASALSGYGEGGAYQRQSGFNNLAVALVALLTRWLDWGLYAEAANCSVLLVFLVLSSGNHLYSALKEGNRTFRSYSRPVATALLLAVIVPVMARALAHAP